MSDALKIIGLAGTNGSGKDTVGQILADDHNYLFVSVTELLRAEANRRSQAPNRENLRAIGNEWRQQQGSDILVDKALEQYKATQEQYSGLAVASIRNPGEADRVHELGGTMVWVDADPNIRYDRIQANKTNRGRAEEDDKTFEQFQAEEAAEMNNSSSDDTKLNMSAVKDRCDRFISNDHNDIEALRLDITKTLDLQKY